jgi:hypothetical protein
VALSLSHAYTILKSDERCLGVHTYGMTQRIASEAAPTNGIIAGLGLTS